MGSSNVPDFADSVHELEINWHRPPMSYRAPTRPLRYSELWSITEIEGVLETLTRSETAGWILDVISDKAQLTTTLHACMDALHHHESKRRGHR